MLSFCCAPAAADLAAESISALPTADASPKQDGGVAAAQPRSPAGRGASPAASAAAQGGGGEAAGAASLEMILQELETTELSVYMQIFDSFGPDAQGLVSTEDEPMRGFLQRVTSVGDGLDPAIFASGAIDQGGVSLEAFVGIIREHAVSETRAIEEYLGFAAEQEASAEDCRARLRSLCEQDLAAHLSEDQWDGVLTNVMREVGGVVDMDVWVGLARHCARIIRLTQVGQ